ncbi:MAG: hypothetical protein IPO92_24315 [Saprospiraceae bacterium]|nr:hypothetical protein [Saprospiraceae bacterium]
MLELYSSFLGAHMANCQVVTFSPVPGSTGVMELTTNGAPSGANFFYLLSDGFFSAQNFLFVNIIPLRILAILAKSYVLNSYGSQTTSCYYVIQEVFRNKS